MIIWLHTFEKPLPVPLDLVDGFIISNRESALQEVHHLQLPNLLISETLTLRGGNAAIQQELQTFKAMFGAINRSLSWRYTAPFRAITGFFRKLKNNFHNEHFASS